MLRAEDNQFLTESGAGTPMGELLRQFWLPVLLSEELPDTDGPPKKIVVMGEELLAFRDSRGVVGVIDQYCPHRGANLWLGRNEECGIRCVYHGWKFDTDGRCIDMPTSYPDLNAKDLIRIKSYPVREWGDMIWAYMGPASMSPGSEIPDLPALEMALLPASHRYVSKKWQDCNWVQALEGSIDTAHFTFAHLSFDKEEDEVLDIKKHFVNPIARMNVDHMRWIAEDPRPVIKIAPHDAGLTIAGGPAHRQRQYLLAHRAVFDAGACLCAERDAGREYFRPELHPGDRYPLLDLHLCLESGTAADAGRARYVSRRQWRDLGS
jgi:phthalate 4,5-dioxygenase oxygenase subunit